MTAPERVWGDAASARLYRCLWFVLPRDFRRRYGADATDVFRDLYRSAYRQGGVRGALGVWRRAFGQTVVTGLAERFSRPSRPPVRNPGPTDRSHRESGGFYVALCWQEIRFALRSLRRSPGFSLTAAAILALGIGATTGIVSVVDGVLLRALPYPDPERLVYFDEGNHTVPDYGDWLERTTAFSQLSAMWVARMDLTNEGHPTRVSVVRATPSVFTMFGARADLGRLFASNDARGKPRIAVVSHRFWLARWGADPTVIGRSLRVGTQEFTVVGVMAADFLPPHRLTRGPVDLWVPLDVTLPEEQRRDFYVLGVAGRLAPGTPLTRAQAEIDAWEEAMAELYPDQYRYANGSTRQVPLVPLHDAVVGESRRVLYLMLGAVGSMLLIACANVANLFLARGTDRERELALRAALGASRSRIALQLLTESVVLAVMGGGVGAALAFAGVNGFDVFAPADLPRIENLSVDVRVLGSVLGISVVTGVLFGIVPALYAARTDVRGGLAEGTGRTTAGVGRLRMKSALVVLEIALAMVLLAGAGLLFNSFLRLRNVDPGFHPAGLVVMPLDLGRGYNVASADSSDEGKRVRFTRALLDELHAIPGVQHATAGWTVPFGRSGRCCWRTRLRTAPGASPDSLLSIVHPVAPSYFATLGIPIVRGSTFSWSDRNTNPLSAIVNRVVADRFFAGGDPLGKTLTIGSYSATVIGVIGSVEHWDLAADDDPDVYISYAARGNDAPMLQVALRAEGDLAGIAAAMRAAVWSLDPSLPVPDISTMPQRMSDSIASQRFVSDLLVVFALLALFLAAGGIYATMLYGVGQRHHEFGIRLALGAPAQRLLSQVVWHGARLTGFGIGLGIVGAIAMSRVLASLLFDLSPTDPLTLGVVAAILAATALAACYLPARKAASTDPLESLRGS